MHKMESVELKEDPASPVKVDPNDPFADDKPLLEGK